MVDSGTIRRTTGERQTDTRGTSAVPASDSAVTGNGRMREKWGEEVGQAIQAGRADYENTNTQLALLR